MEYHFKTTKELREQNTKLEKEHLEEKSELTKKIEDLEESVSLFIFGSFVELSLFE